MPVRLHLTLSVIALIATGLVAQAEDRPAANVHDLRDHFASCFHPPEAANTRVTFYFAMNAKGGLIGPPRTTWLGFTGSPEERTRELGRFDQELGGCLPVALDRRMAATLPGEVYFLQYVVGPDGHEQQVLFRPFGSHGGFAPLPLEPSAGAAFAPEPPPLSRPSPVFRPRPMHGRVFDAPKAFNSPGLR